MLAFTEVNTYKQKKQIKGAHKDKFIDIVNHIREGHVDAVRSWMAYYTVALGKLSNYKVVKT